jgi:hypothetical protein
MNNPNATTLDLTLSTLGDKYNMKQAECDPGVTASKITKQGSGLTVYIIASNDTDDIEFITFDGDETVKQTSLYMGIKSVDECANIIRNCF